MHELTKLGVAETSKLLLKGAITATELVKEYLDLIRQNNQQTNSFILVTEELALKQAAESDRRLRENTHRILEGIPIAVKDLFCTKGIRTTACSRILENFVPEYESTVTHNLFTNGGICLGKTNMDEFAMGSSTTTSCFGPTLNPLRRQDQPEVQLVPGGSSGGSAAAVAAHLAPASLGSDTGGSIRQPAAFCGLVGIKPSYGRCSRYGMVAFSSSLDQAGVFARSVKDSAMVLQSIVGYDTKDSTSVNLPAPNFMDAFGYGIKGLRIGIPKEYMVPDLDPDIIRIWDQSKEWLREAGAEIIEISLPHTMSGLSTYYIIAPAEASSNLARYDGVRFGTRISSGSETFSEMVTKTRGDLFGEEVQRRIMIGTYVLSAGAYDEFFGHAQRIRRLIKNDFDSAFTKVDAILTPVTPTPAFGLNEKQDNPITMYLNDLFAIPASLAGLPAISVPCGADSKHRLPLGLQVIGRLYDELTIFKIAETLENAQK